MNEKRIYNGILAGGGKRDQALTELVNALQSRRWWHKSGYEMNQYEQNDAIIFAVLALYLKIEAGLFTYQSEGGMNRYLKTAMQRRAMEENKKGGIEFTELEKVDAEFDYNKGPREDFLDELFREEDVEEEIRECRRKMKAVSERCKDIIEKIILRGFSHAACAADMSMSESNLRTTKSRCMEKLIANWNE